MLMSMKIASGEIRVNFLNFVFGIMYLTEQNVRIVQRYSITYGTNLGL